MSSIEKCLSSAISRWVVIHCAGGANIPATGKGRLLVREIAQAFVSIGR
jgi:hypothetical protein